MAETVKMQLSLLYRAGKKSFPARAETLAGALQTIGEVHEQWRPETVRAGSPPALTQAMAINAEVYELLRAAALSYQDVAHALVAIADDFVITDDRAEAVAKGANYDLDTLAMPDLPRPPTLEETS